MGCSNSVETDGNQIDSKPSSPKPKPVVSTTQTRWETEALKCHNSFRVRHSVPPLVIDAEISRKAQRYAEYLANNNLFQHSSDRDDLGENLYSMSSWQPLTNEALGTIATESWYGEIESYDFNNPGFSMETGHFTQVVWKNSKKLGLGVAFADGGKQAIVVAQYGPAGNYMGQFPENVPPPKK